MKKLFALMMALAMVLSLAACGGSSSIVRAVDEYGDTDGKGAKSQWFGRKGCPKQAQGCWTEF
jgi:uncharacterized lipoprotein YehR (DUF1307 family)